MYTKPEMLESLMLTTVTATLLVALLATVSLPVMANVSEPANPLVGVYVNPPLPANVALIAASRAVIVTLAVPLVAISALVNPPLMAVDNVRMPCVADRVSVTLLVVGNEVSATDRPVAPAPIVLVGAYGRGSRNRQRADHIHGRAIAEPVFPIDRCRRSRSSRYRRSRSGLDISDRSAAASVALIAAKRSGDRQVARAVAGDFRRRQSAGNVGQ